jgi:hypothetical protein
MFDAVAKVRERCASHSKLGPRAMRPAFPFQQRQSIMTREAFEAALDRGRLETRYHEFLLNDLRCKWHACRRDGKTRILGCGFIIPIEFKLNDSASISNAEFLNGHVDMWFRIISPVDASRPDKIYEPLDVDLAQMTDEELDEMVRKADAEQAQDAPGRCVRGDQGGG